MPVLARACVARGGCSDGYVRREGCARTCREKQQGRDGARGVGGRAVVVVDGRKTHTLYGKRGRGKKGKVTSALKGRSTTHHVRRSFFLFSPCLWSHFCRLPPAAGKLSCELELCDPSTSTQKMVSFCQTAAAAASRERLSSTTMLIVKWICLLGAVAGGEESPFAGRR